jgi:hypothetical protein
MLWLAQPAGRVRSLQSFGEPAPSDFQIPHSKLTQYPIKYTIFMQFLDISLQE